MKKQHIIPIMALAGLGHAHAAVLVTTTRAGNNSTAGSTIPGFSSTDLGQTAYLNSSGTTAEALTEHAQLFNGAVGNTDGDTADSGEVTIDPGGSITITLDTSVNSFGYDITGIYTLAGWSVESNGRSNQGYSITLTFMDDSAATLLSGTAWEGNTGTANYWTTVSFANSGGGALQSDTFAINGGTATAGLDVTATGVKSITFGDFSAARAGGPVVLREIDITGVATVPEPDSVLLGAVGLLGLLRRRRS